MPRTHLTGSGVPRHFTTRRGFVSGLGFSLVSLYALWAGYGAAPTGMSAAVVGKDGEGTGHGGMAMGGGGGMTPEEFRRLTEQFVATNQLPDGSVKPTITMAGMPMPGMAMPGMAMPGMAMPGAAEGGAVPDGAAAPGMHTGHAAAPRTSAGEAGESIDVYLLANRYGYTPSVLRLERGRTYRFRMMAVDASHGASINVGRASHMIRLPYGILAEQEIAFAERGEHFVYCTVFCGEGHDRMQGKIIVD